MHALMSIGVQFSKIIEAKERFPVTMYMAVIRSRFILISIVYSNVVISICGHSLPCEGADRCSTHIDKQVPASERKR